MKNNKYYRQALFYLNELLGYEPNITLEIVKGPDVGCIQNLDGSYRVETDGKKRSLAHEIAHVAQMVKGRLVPLQDVVIWEGEYHPLPSFTSDDYFLAPWEMEARAMEEWLIYKWSLNELH